MKILVTGSNGQLGNEMRCQAEVYACHEFCFTDVDSLDICNREAVMQKVADFQPDAIVNCAAFTAVDAAEDQAALCDRLNHLAPGILAEAAAGCGAAFIHISTDYVFDGSAHIPYREEDVPNPATVYGSTKLKGEQLVFEKCSNSVILRTAWLYSPFGNNFVKTMLRLGREREAIGVVFDQVGTPTYAKDLAGAIMTILNKGVIPGIYHFSDEGVCSWFDFTKTIHKMAGIETCKVRPLHTDEYPAKAQRPHYSVLDKTKIKQTYQMEIPYWTDSLMDCLQRMK